MSETGVYLLLVLLHHIHMRQDGVPAMATNGLDEVAVPCEDCLLDATRTARTLTAAGVL